MEVGTRSILGRARPQQYTTPWQCDILPALRATASCSAHDATDCNIHYVRRDGSSSLCEVFHSGHCTEGATFSGCPVAFDELDPAAAGEHVAACIDAAGRGIYEELVSSTTISYAARINHTIRGMRPALDQAYAKLGYLGAVACAAFLTAPVGAPSHKPWVTYSLVLWNSFLCPPFDDGISDPAIRAAWPSGALRFGCWPGTPDKLVRYAWPSKSFHVGEPPTAEIYNTTAHLQRDTTKVSSWLSHVWACTRGRAASSAASTNFTLRPHAIPNATVMRDSMHHVHLPHATCGVVHAAVSSRPELWPPLRAIHGYQMATDPTDHGKHGLMHEFGVYVARRVLHDDDALSQAWHLFLLFYVTPAPMHSFLSTVFGGRTEVSGAPVEKWALSFCDHFLRDSTLLGTPALSDAPLHLFGECVHGIGHGMAVRHKLSKLDTKLQIQPEWTHACAEVGARFDEIELPEAVGNLSAFFRYSCVMGIRHHVRNNVAGRSYHFPGALGENASQFLRKMANDVYHTQT